MIVDVLPVSVGGDNKSVLAFGETHRQFIARLVGFFSGDLTGPKGLPNLIGNYIIFLSAPGHKLILPLREHYKGSDYSFARMSTADRPQNAKKFLEVCKFGKNLFSDVDEFI